MSLLGRLFRWRTLRARILLALVGLTLALGIVVGVQATLSMTRVLEGRLEDLGTAIANDLAARSAAPSQTNDVFTLFDVVNDSLLNNEDVRYIFLEEPSGEIRVHTFEHGVPPGLVDANTPDPTGLQSVRKLKTSEGTILDFAVPVLEGQGGVIRLGMSQARVRRQVTGYIVQLSLVVGAGVLVAIVLSFVISSLLTRPLSRLTEAAHKVGKGDFDRKVPSDAEDEVGDLARAFNTMTDDIVRSQESLLQRNAELETLNSMADTLGRQLGRQQVLDTSVRRLLELTHLSTAWACVQGPGDHMTLAAYRGNAGSTPVNLKILPEDGCDCLGVPETGSGAEVKSIVGCPLMGNGNPVGETDRTHAVVPLGSRVGVVGVLVVASEEAAGFDEAHMRLLTSIGQQVGVALENANLYEELERKERVRAQLLYKLIGAQEEERKRISREIHDEPTQALSGVLMQLDNIGQRLVGARREPERKEIERVRPSVRAAIESLQRITSDLRPEALDDLGFVPAIRWYIQQRLEDQGIDVGFDVVGRPNRLPSPIEVAVFRIAQEAINNIARHAEATKVHVRLGFDDASISGEVRDDGKGFDPESLSATPAQGAGLGLLGMRERAEILGGSLSVDSNNGQGTCVGFKIPLDEGRLVYGQ